MCKNANETSKEFKRCVCLSGCAAVCGARAREADPGGEDDGAAADVSAGGDCRPLLQPAHAARPAGEGADPKHQRGRHRPVHQAVD